MAYAASIPTGGKTCGAYSHLKNSTNWNFKERCDVEHRVKVTVLDKNYFRNYRRNIVQYPTAESVPAIMLAMNLCFIAMMSAMIIGIWEQVH